MTTEGCAWREARDKTSGQAEAAFCSHDGLQSSGSLATSHLSPEFTQEQPTSQFTPVRRGAQMDSRSPSATPDSVLTLSLLTSRTDL